MAPKEQKKTFEDSEKAEKAASTKSQYHKGKKEQLQAQAKEKVDKKAKKSKGRVDKLAFKVQGYECSTKNETFTRCQTKSKTSEFCPCMGGAPK